MRFIEYRVPSALDQVRRVLAIPAQRTDKPLVPFLTGQETKTLFDAPDAAAPSGIRDRAMLYVAVAGGLRVSELVGTRISDINFDGNYVEIRVRGKGRRQRALVLWKEAADAIRGWLAVRGEETAPELFLNARGEAMTRSGFEYILRKHARSAMKASPSIGRKRVSPHVLRHTCAVNVLRATGDIRKVALWLGHASQQTTEMYLQIDPTEKLDMMDAVALPALKRGKFRAPDALIAALQGR
jgi:site-specific recombinase XerD